MKVNTTIYPNNFDLDQRQNADDSDVWYFLYDGVHYELATRQSLPQTQLFSSLPRPKRSTNSNQRSNEAKEPGVRNFLNAVKQTPGLDVKQPKSEKEEKKRLKRETFFSDNPAPRKEVVGRKREPLMRNSILTSDM